MKKLWQKNTTAESNLLVEKYTSGDDILLDQKLVAFDIYGSAAQVKMLRKIGLMNEQEKSGVLAELKVILQKFEQGEYILQFGDEDVHTRIENDVTQKEPIAGAKVHTGRSRNDQVLLDLRLFTKHHIHSIALKVTNVLDQFLVLAQKYEKVPMPGYSHMQQAMLSSVGLWLEQFAESLQDDLKCLEMSYELSDKSPLGSGAGYGVSLQLDRELTANLLGFKSVQSNSLYCQNSRGKIEGTVLHAFTQIMATCGRFAQDVLLFTTSEFHFLKFPDYLTTGSSIMPQKRNMDIMELVRARAKTMQSYEALVVSLSLGLPSGYNRDLQEMKKPYFEAFELIDQTLDVMLMTLSALEVNAEQLSSSITPQLYAAHHAYQLVQHKNLPFREAYAEVGNHLSDLPTYDPIEVLAQTNHSGAAGNLAFEELNAWSRLERQSWEKRKKEFDKKLVELFI